MKTGPRAWKNDPRMLKTIPGGSFSIIPGGRFQSSRGLVFTPWHPDLGCEVGVPGSSADLAVSVATAHQSRSTIVFNHPGGSFSIIRDGTFFIRGGRFSSRGVVFHPAAPRTAIVRQAILGWGYIQAIWKLHSRRGRGRKIRATICGADFLGNCSIWGIKKIRATVLARIFRPRGP